MGISMIKGRVLPANLNEERWRKTPKEEGLKLQLPFSHLISHLAGVTKTLAVRTAHTAVSLTNKFKQQYQAGLTDPEPL